MNNIEYEYQGLMTDFSKVGGVGIMGFISPMDTLDTYAVIDPIYGIDGLRNIDTLNELNDISLERRRAGMIVGVEGGNRYFKLRDILWTFQLTDWEELLLMSCCQHNIIANSSFSWWGAYLSNNPIQITCYPSKWFGPLLTNKNDTSDLFPPTWSCISF